jgi:GH18 family chitinase
LIDKSLDFFNIMTYDLMNRRDTITKHHTGVELSLEAIETYLALGVPAEKANLGFAFYIKWFKTAPGIDCWKTGPVGCPAALMEDPSTGADLGKAGAFSWVDGVPEELVTSYRKAMEKGMYDDVHGGHYWWDSEEEIWWSWDNPRAISLKFPLIVEKLGLGGAFAWGLGEDSRDWRHLKALNEGVKRHVRNTAVEVETKLEL